MEPIDELQTYSVPVYYSGGTTNEYWGTWCGTTFNSITLDPAIIKEDEVKLLGDKLKELKK